MTECAVPEEVAGADFAVQPRAERLAIALAAVVEIAAGCGASPTAGRSGAVDVLQGHHGGRRHAALPVRLSGRLGRTFLTEARLMPLDLGRTTDRRIFDDRGGSGRPAGNGRDTTVSTGRMATSAPVRRSAALCRPTRWWWMWSGSGTSCTSRARTPIRRATCRHRASCERGADSPLGYWRNSSTSAGRILTYRRSIRAARFSATAPAANLRPPPPPRAGPEAGGGTRPASTQSTYRRAAASSQQLTPGGDPDDATPLNEKPAARGAARARPARAARGGAGEHRAADGGDAPGRPRRRLPRRCRRSRCARSSARCRRSARPRCSSTSMKSCAPRCSRS